MIAGPVQQQDYHGRGGYGHQDRKHDRKEEEDEEDEFQARQASARHIGARDYDADEEYSATAAHAGYRLQQGEDAAGPHDGDYEPSGLEAEYEDEAARSQGEEEQLDSEKIRTNFLKLFHELAHEPNPQFLLEELAEMAKLLDQKLVYMEVSKAVDEILRTENYNFPLKSLLDLLSNHMEAGHREKVLILLLVTGGIQRNFLEYSGVKEFFARSQQQTKCLKFSLDSIFKCYANDQADLVEIFVGNMIELIAKMPSRQLGEVCELLVKGLDLPDCADLSEHLLLRVFKELGSEEFNNITERALVNKKQDLHRLWRWRTQSEASNVPDAFDQHSNERLPDLHSLDIRKKLDMNSNQEGYSERLPQIQTASKKDLSKPQAVQAEQSVAFPRPKNPNEYTFNAFQENSTPEPSFRGLNERNRLEKARLDRHSQKGTEEPQSKLLGDNFDLHKLGLLKKNMGVEDLQSSNQTDFLQNSPQQDDSLNDPYNLGHHQGGRYHPSSNAHQHGEYSRQYQTEQEQESMYDPNQSQKLFENRRNHQPGDQAAEVGQAPRPGSEVYRTLAEMEAEIQASYPLSQQGKQDRPRQNSCHSYEDSLASIPIANTPQPASQAADRKVLTGQPSVLSPSTIQAAKASVSVESPPPAKPSLSEGQHEGQRESSATDQQFLAALQQKYNWAATGSEESASKLHEEQSWRLKFEREKRAHSETLAELKKLNERFEESREQQAARVLETTRVMKENRSLTEELHELRTKVKDLETSLKSSTANSSRGQRTAEDSESSRITEFGGFGSPLDKVYSYYQTASSGKAREAALAILLQVVVEEQQLSSGAMAEFLAKCEKFDDKSFLVDLRDCLLEFKTARGITRPMYEGILRFCIRKFASQNGEVVNAIINHLVMTQTVELTIDSLISILRCELPPVDSKYPREVCELGRVITRLLNKLIVFSAQSKQYPNCFQTLLELFKFFKTHPPSKLSPALPSYAEIEPIFKELREFSDVGWNSRTHSLAHLELDVVIKLEPVEADKFYRTFKHDHGHNLFLSYVFAYSNKVKAQSSGDMVFADR